MARRPAARLAVRSAGSASHASSMGTALAVLDLANPYATPRSHRGRRGSLSGRQRSRFGCRGFVADEFDTRDDHVDSPSPASAVMLARSVIRWPDRLANQRWPLCEPALVDG